MIIVIIAREAVNAKLAELFSKKKYICLHKKNFLQKKISAKKFSAKKIPAKKTPCLKSRGKKFHLLFSEQVLTL